VANSPELYGDGGANHSGSGGESTFAFPQPRDGRRNSGILADAYGFPVVRAAIARAQRNPWQAEPDVGRVVDGLPTELVEPRLRSLGNAVVPQIPELIGNAILASMREAA
jgi:hypothetical protein